jgi:ZIP family zinc transporter
VGAGAALGWGALAASSLVIGAAAGLIRPWPSRLVGLVLAFGAGALISAVSFELAQEGVEVGGLGWVALGLAAGALAYVVADRAVARLPGDGGSLAVGALLDGIPEQLVLGIAVASGNGVSLGLLGAIFVSNLPEALGSATEMRESGGRPVRILALWTGVAVVCTLAAPAGFALAEVTGGRFEALINGFAAGALLVMLVDTMIPDALGRAGKLAGLATTLGFAVAFALSLTAA